MSVLKQVQRYVDEIKRTGPGMERNMYPSIKSLLVSAFGHRSEEVYTDVATPSARLRSRNIPDVQVSVRLDNGLILSCWLIVEAKDEPGIFKDAANRENIFMEKSKYITSDTEWFVMVDPETWVCRYLKPGHKEYEDTVIELQDFDPAFFFDACKGLHRNHAVLQGSLQEFRDGNEEWIASINLDSLENKKRFYDDLQKSFKLLLNGCVSALRQIENDYLAPLDQMLNDFKSKYGNNLDISFKPFFIKNPPPNIDNINSYREDVKSLRKMYYRNPNTFKLVLDVLPILNYRQSMNDRDKNKVFERIAMDTASLILSRILMLRFFEDHSFFGSKKYLCNGGVKIFNEIRSYFSELYPSLIKRACEEGAKFYDAIFTETEYDWVFDNTSIFLSDYIERVLYYLSFYNFRTVREDILSGIYQMVIDSSLRKKHGQVYTLPPIAKFLIERCLQYSSGDHVMDPACGTGTFLVEYFELKYGDSIRRNVMSYHSICQEISKIKGNDLNPVAASLAQMQMLWRLLSFSEEMKRIGLPEIVVTSNDALAVKNIFFYENEWDELDNNTYDLIIGNPPYVRSERQIRRYGQNEEIFYEAVSVRSNLYTLFVYKALKNWLKENGILGFVLPLSILDSGDSANLRKLFTSEGIGTILEIVDMEEIAKEVFPDVAVNPILLIVQKRSPKSDDRVVLRVAHRDVLQMSTNGGIHFDFSKCESVELFYSDIFTPDGRILTRLNSRRKSIIDKIAQNQTWADIAREYWVKRSGRRIVEATLSKPDNLARWESRKMIGRGAVFRRKVKYIDNGMPVYKGENISSCRVVEPPVERNIDVLAMDDPSFWRFPLILPEVGYAFQNISLNLTAALFNPRESVFLDTTTLFFPVKELEGFPFDFLILSSVYQWYFAMSQREAAVSLLWSHIYPRTVYRLPWNDKLIEYTERLHALRNNYLNSCYQTNQVSLEQLYSISPLETLEERAQRNQTLKIRWSKLAENDTIIESELETWHRYYFDLFDYFDVNDEQTYRMLAIILPVLKVTTADPSTILTVKLPSTAEGEKVWNELSSGAIRSNAEKVKKESLEKLDAIVAEAFGLTEEEEEFIKKDLETDPFLKKLKPIEPYTQRNLRGFLSGLDSPDRYA